MISLQRPDFSGLAADLAGPLAAVLFVLVAHQIIFHVAGRTAARTAKTIDDLAVAHVRQPTRWIACVLALSASLRGVELTAQAHGLATLVIGLILPPLIGWLGVAVLKIAREAIEARSDVTVADNLAARRRRTRAAILYRIGMFVIWLIAFCMMLMAIPGVRNIGVTLIASAGLAGLAVGAAAQPALKNVIAGMQMAMTEPIRLDDVVIIAGEWGRIEEIHLTFVVVRIWDDRRLVVPVSRFLDESFENWTRNTSEITGAVIWYVDPAADIAALREKLKQLVAAHPLWDRRFCNLQVTGTTAEAIEVRALMTAKDASAAFDLRCDIREAMLAYLRDSRPGDVARRRVQLA